MTREEYKAVLLDKSFVYQGAQKGFPGRGEQDKFSHPSYKYMFYVTRYDKDDESSYGFSTGKLNSKYFDSIYPHNAEDTFANDRGLLVWVDDSFIKLMGKMKA